MAQLLHLSVCEMYFFFSWSHKGKMSGILKHLWFCQHQQCSIQRLKKQLGWEMFFLKLSWLLVKARLSATAQIAHIIISGSPQIPYYPNYVINYVMKASAAPTFWDAEPCDNDPWFPSSSSRLELNWSDYRKVLSCQGCLILPVLSVCCSRASFSKCSKKPFPV